MKKIISVMLFLFIGYSYMLGQSVTGTDVYSFVYQNKTYEVVKINKTWQEAIAAAVAQGGYLAEINSQAEQDEIFNQLSSKAGIVKTATVADEGGGAAYVWIGGSDFNSEGEWVFDGDSDGTGTKFWQGASNGSIIDGQYNNWGHGTDGKQHEPDNYHNSTIPHQNALAIALDQWPSGSGTLGQAGQWNDLYENNALYFLVEYDSLKKQEDNKVGLNGSGTEADPYQISSLDDLVWLAKADSIWDDGLYFKQTADIDASCTDTMTIAGFNPGWSPIGNAVTSFIGTYDGGGHTIDGLVTHGTSSNVGLFGLVKSLNIKDLGLTNVNMAVGGSSGTLVGYADSNLVIDNCYSTGSLVIDGAYSGGFVGFIQNSKFNITNSHSEVEVLNVHVGTNAYAGGFIGYIEITGDNDISGIIEDCYSTGNVSLTDQAGKYGYAGGFIARTHSDEFHTKWSEIRRCYSTGNVIGVTGSDGNTYSPAGGFIGNVNWRYKVSECYSTGNVTSIGKDAGGFIGYLKYEGRVENCYSTGNVTRVSGSTQPNFGGFIGSQNAWGSSPVYYSVVKNCYSTGKVTGTDINGYGFFGHQASACKDTANFWDKELAMQDSSIGNATGLTTAEMKTESTFTDAGWDFDNVWEIIGDNYPTLQMKKVDVNEGNRSLIYPTRFVLEQNYPNPFNPTTVIEFALPKQAAVKLSVYNILGEKVAELVNGTLSAGYHSVSFNASDLSSGIYIYKITAGNFVSVKKMMLLK